MSEVTKLIGLTKAAKITARHFPEMGRAGNIASLNHLKTLTDQQILNVKGIGRKTLWIIRRHQ